VRRWQASARLLGVVVGEDGKLSMLANGLTNRWRDKPVAEITGDDVHHIVDEVRERGVPGLERRRNGKPSDSQARIMRATLSVLVGWLLDKRRIAANPVATVATPKPGKPRDRVLSDAEIKNFWHACDKIEPAARQCLRLLLLTGARLNEIAKLRRDE